MSDTQRAPKRGSKVNVGVRTPAEDQIAANEQVAAAIAAGKEVVVEDGATFIVSREPNITVKTRIA